MRSWLVNHLILGIDGIFLLLSALCFGWFVQNSIWWNKSASDITGAVAHVQHGYLDRKRAGTVMFTEASPGAPLFNRDALWVGEGRDADIEFEDGSGLRLLERTFLVLRRSPSAGEQGQVIQLLSGKIRVRPSKSFLRKLTIEIDTGRKRISLQSIPTDSEITPNQESVDKPLALPEVPLEKPPARPVIAEKTDIYPKPDTIFYFSKVQQSPITFGWPDALNGVLLVTNEANVEVVRAFVRDSRHVKAELKSGHSYTWKVVGQDSKTILGPYRIQIRPFDAKAVQDAIQGNPDKTIEIIE